MPIPIRANEEYYINLCENTYDSNLYTFEDDYSNPYIDKLTRISSTNIQNLNTAKTAFENKKERGLFNLFFTENLTDTIVDWTNSNYARTGTQTICKNDVNTFIGLELAMSLKKGGNIEEHWSKEPFLGDPNFALYSSREKHQNIRTHIQSTTHHLHATTTNDARCSN